MNVKESIRKSSLACLRGLTSYIKDPRNIVFLCISFVSLCEYLLIIFITGFPWAKVILLILKSPLSYYPWILYLFIFSLIDRKIKPALFYGLTTNISIQFLIISMLTVLLQLDFRILSTLLPRATIFIILSGPACIGLGLTRWASKRCNESKRFNKALPGCLLLIAVGIAIVLVKTKPTAEKVRPQKRAALVEVQALKRTDETIILRVTGTVTPAKKIRLRARVSGEIISIDPDFIEGGQIAQGASILNIDPADYELALTQSRSKLEQARFDYQLELGRQDVAKREWELLKPEGDVSELETELALRTPHLKASEAALRAAESSLKQAELDLERTEVSAPFNTVILSRGVDVGSQAVQQDMLAELAGTDSYWITASIPVDRIQWVQIPGSFAHIYSGSQHVREGTVIRLLGDLEDKGRMARLLIEVKDPLAQLPENASATPLLLGEYVRADIHGRVANQAVRIPRSALRENSQVWLATDNDKLEVRAVEILWRDADHVLISKGLSAGEQLIISDLTAPAPGMDLRTEPNPSED